MLRFSTVPVMIVAGQIAMGCSCVGIQPFCNRPPDSKDRNKAIFVGVVNDVYPGGSIEDYGHAMYPDFGPSSRTPPNLQQMKDSLLRVWSGALLPEEERKIRDAKSPRDLDMPFKDLLWSMPRRVRFTITEKFMGVEKNTFELFTGIGDGDCGVVFETGEAYLIEASKDEATGRWTSSICSRTQHVRSADPDLMALRAWERGEKLRPLVYGSVEDWTNRGNGWGTERRPLADLKLTLRAEDEVKETTTDSEGRFSIGNLSSKLYRLDADLPGWRFLTIAEARRSIDLVKNSCSELFLEMEQLQGAVRGKVVSATGKLPGVIWIEAIPVGNEKLKSRVGSTNDVGEFEIEALEPGNYVLAIDVEHPPATNNSRNSKFERITPYPPMYYPGTADRARAAVVHFERGQVLNLPPWNLPPPVPERSIEGVVLWPDKRPASTAKVILTVTSTGVDASLPRPVAADGSFKFFGLADLAYTIRVAAYDGAEKLYFKASLAAPIGDQTAVIVLSPDGREESDKAFSPKF